MPKSKKFIDRKNAVTFNLVHRSQRDPLIADENAPQRVLVPVNAATSKENEKDKEAKLDPTQRKEEQKKYGIFFDDDYNYLQHLRDTKEVTLLLAPKPTKSKKEAEKKKEIAKNLNLPSSVFASEIEEDVGMLNKAAPQGLRLDLDPDVVAAMDDDFNFDDPNNELEDNFMELAMAEASESHSDYSDSENDSDGSDTLSACSGQSQEAFACSDDEDGPWKEGGRGKMPSWDKFGDEETKSRFSQYSMSSSVMRRNGGLTLLDDRFEKMFAEYDDTELGPLDCEDIEGYMPDTDSMLLQAAEEFHRQQQKGKIDKDKEMAKLTRLQEIEEESEDEELVKMAVPEKQKWDCESILSTYSNLYNHPKLIDEPKKLRKIKINPKTGIPLDTLGQEGVPRLTIKSLAKFNSQLNSQNDNSNSDDENETNADTILSTLSVLSLRPKDETPDEKKERKRLLKEYRKERRVEKKANKEAFKEEKKRQEKILLNNRNNVQGNRIL